MQRQRCHHKQVQHVHLLACKSFPADVESCEYLLLGDHNTSDGEGDFDIQRRAHYAASASSRRSHVDAEGCLRRLLSPLRGCSRE